MNVFRLSQATVFFCSLLALACSETVPAIHLQIRNVGSETVFKPKLQYGSATIDSGEQAMLLGNSSRGRFANYATPDTAQLSWEVGGRACKAVFALGDAARARVVDRAAVMFDISGQDSSAHVQTNPEDGSNPTALQKTSVLCSDISGWVRPDECAITDCENGRPKP